MNPISTKVLVGGMAAVALISSIAAVAAFESHTVNVQAHIENAIQVQPVNKMIGGSAVFPEEWVTAEFFVDASDSFAGQTRVNTVDYIVCAKPKIMPYQSGKYFHWMGGGAYFSTDDGSTWTHIGPPHVEGTVPVYPPGVVCPSGVGGTITTTTGSSFLLGFDVPVREENYNPLTDVCDKPRPNTGSFNPLNGSKTSTSPDMVDGLAGGPCQAPSMIVANSVSADDAKYALFIIVQVTDLSP